MSEPKILEVVQTADMQIGAGQLSDLLIKDQEGAHVESPPNLCGYPSKACMTVWGAFSITRR